MAKYDRTDRYHVVFEQVFVPEKEIFDIQSLEVYVYAKTIEEAKDKAWDAVNLRQEDYHIVLINNINSRFSTFSIKHRPYDC